MATVTAPANMALLPALELSSYGDTLTLQARPAVEAVENVLPEEIAIDQAVVIVRSKAPETPVVCLQAQPETGNVPQVTILDGKGGLSVIVADDQGLYWMALPGSQLALPGLKVWVARVGLTDAGQPDWRPLQPKPTPMPEIPAASPQTVTTQAMILGAGLATRFEPVSGDRTGVSKPGTPLVDGFSVISAIVGHLAQYGITDIFINTYTLPEQLKASLYPVAQAVGVRLHYLDEDAPSGTAGALRKLLETSMEAFQPDQPLLVVQGDAVTNADMAALLHAHQAKNALVTLGCMTTADEDVNKFGIIATDRSGDDGHSGNILTFLEKPCLEDAGPHRLANTGFYVFSPQAYSLLLATYNAKPAAEQQIFDYALDVFPAVLQACNDLEADGAGIEGLPKRFWAQQIKGYWSDIGNPLQYWQTCLDVHNNQQWFPWCQSLTTEPSAEALTDGATAAQSTLSSSTVVLGNTLHTGSPASTGALSSSGKGLAVQGHTIFWPGVTPAQMAASALPPYQYMGPVVVMPVASVS